MLSFKPKSLVHLVQRRIAIIVLKRLMSGPHRNRVVTLKEQELFLMQLIKVRECSECRVSCLTTASEHDANTEVLGRLILL